ncbi:hypothetical protein [Methylocystis echinoides]|uniref:hypothetical protein n=1 Tax=Methylocystis echinoides TaxID=29468 RepID=UPI00341540AF
MRKFKIKIRYKDFPQNGNPNFIEGDQIRFVKEVLIVPKKRLSMWFGRGVRKGFNGKVTIQISALASKYKETSGLLVMRDQFKAN